MASVHAVGRRWCVRWRDGGRGTTQRQRTVSSRRAALELAAEIELQLEQRGEYRPASSGRSSPVEVLVADYLADVGRRRSAATAERYAQLLGAWVAWSGGDARAHERLSFASLSAWHAAAAVGRRGRARAPETVRRHVDAVELLWRWSWQRQARGDYHGIPQPDTLGLERQPAGRKRAPAWHEIDAMIAAASGWHRDLYLVLRCTGLRVQQALELRWSDLVVDDGRAELRVRGELGKSRQERRGRIVPVAPVLLDELAGWGRRTGHLLDCGRASRVARARDAGRAWRRAEVPDDVWRGCPHHAIRAGFVTGLRRAGADADAVEHLVGHSLGAVRERYLDATALPLVAAVELVPPLSSGGVVRIGAADPCARGVRGLG